jgi:tRNA pseudouridine38-40 synthase
MPRYLLILEFDGRPFSGWQSQANAPSIQQSLAEAVWKFCQTDGASVAAGRTDAGVHGVALPVHIDLPKASALKDIQGALNAYLRPKPISVLRVEAVEDNFHARFSCLKRHYCYRLLCRRARPALEAGRVWWHARAFDLARMQKAAMMLEGSHDFSAFRAAECQALSPYKTLERLSIKMVDEFCLIEASARSFLHHQVRIMVGTLVAVGHGRLDLDDVARALEGGERAKAGPTAPADGLFFMGADYPNLKC